jgi:hypothetical protein
VSRFLRVFLVMWCRVAAVVFLGSVVVAAAMAGISIDQSLREGTDGLQ